MQREYLHFSVILRPWVLVRPQESNLQPPALQSTRSTDWATTAAVNRTLNRTIMVDKAKQDKGGCFAETCCVISTLFSRSSSSSFFPFFFMSSFTSVSSLSTELRPISNNIHPCYLWWCRYLFNYSAACWFCLTHSAFSKFIWISWNHIDSILGGMLECFSSLKLETCVCF